MIALRKIEGALRLPGTIAPSTPQPNRRGWWWVGLTLAALGFVSQACSLEVGTSPAAAANRTAAALPTAVVLTSVATTELTSVEAVAPTEAPTPTVQVEAPGAVNTLPALAPLPTSTPTPVPTPTPLPVIPAQSPPERIIAPTIGLDAPVQPIGWQEKRLKSGEVTSVWVVPDDAAGWHINSALPGHGDNVVLSGHHNMGSEVFRYIVDLKPGDPVTLLADGRAYTYVVTDRFILPERGVPDEQRRQNAQWIMPTVAERLTLVTCWPYTDNSHRVIVLANPAQRP
jgi:sortase A